LKVYLIYCSTSLILFLSDFDCLLLLLLFLLLFGAGFFLIDDIGLGFFVSIDGLVGVVVIVEVVVGLDIGTGTGIGVAFTLVSILSNNATKKPIV